MHQYNPGVSQWNGEATLLYNSQRVQNQMCSNIALPLEYSAQQNFAFANDISQQQKLGTQANIYIPKKLIFLYCRIFKTFRKLFRPKRGFSQAQILEKQAARYEQALPFAFEVSARGNGTVFVQSLKSRLHTTITTNEGENQVAKCVLPIQVQQTSTQ